MRDVPGPQRTPPRSTPVVVATPLPRPEPRVITAPLPVPVPSRPVEIQPGPQIMGAPQPQSVEVQPVQMETQESPVVVSLLAQADQQSGSGNLDRAAASVERGLRIEPRNARLWSRLAQIRIEQKRPQQAEALAKKSNRFARGNRSTLAKNWKIIAAARTLSGNTKSAAEASSTAELYQ